MIEIRNVTMAYDRAPVVKDVSFDLPTVASPPSLAQMARESQRYFPDWVPSSARRGRSCG